MMICSAAKPSASQSYGRIEQTQSVVVVGQTEPIFFNLCNGLSTAVGPLTSQPTRSANGEPSRDHAGDGGIVLLRPHIAPAYTALAALAEWLQPIDQALATASSPRRRWEIGRASCRTECRSGASDAG